MTDAEINLRFTLLLIASSICAFSVGAGFVLLSQSKTERQRRWSWRIILTAIGLYLPLLLMLT